MPSETYEGKKGKNICASGLCGLWFPGFNLKLRNVLVTNALIKHGWKFTEK